VHQQRRVTFFLSLQGEPGVYWQMLCRRGHFPTCRPPLYALMRKMSEVIERPGYARKFQAEGSVPNVPNFACQTWYASGRGCLLFSCMACNRGVPRLDREERVCIKWCAVCPYQRRQTDLKFFFTQVAINITRLTSHAPVKQYFPHGQPNRRHNQLCKQSPPQA